MGAFGFRFVFVLCLCYNLAKCSQCGVALSDKPENLSKLAVTSLKGVGPKSAERLQRLGIETVQDVLFHLPLRYQDRTRVIPISSLRVGDHAVIEGEVEQTEIRFGRRRSLLVSLSDSSGSLVLRFFHFSAAQKNNLVNGSRLRCFGEVRNGPNSYELVHPEYQLITDATEIAAEQTLTPIYPTTDGMHQISWRDLTQKALAMLEHAEHGLQELLPADLQQRYKLPELTQTVRFLHRPPPDARQDQLLQGIHPAQKRLAFEELLAHQLSLRQLRYQQRHVLAPRLTGDGQQRNALLASLPFELTAAQQRVAAEISHDLEQAQPMLRLVQGDVGSGKTIVAALAALQAVEAGYQVALMAPTELLAEQHRANFSSWLTPLGIRMDWLAGRVKGKQRQAVMDRLSDGSLQVVVGTQALFQDDVQFHSMGLVIVDEQHRFGVHQRLALREKGNKGKKLPHQLIMTATPIPRSLAMTAYADLDLSVIDELPPGRTPVQTIVISDNRRDEIIQRVRNACAVGRQAYWVCTLIEESESLQCQAAEDTASLLGETLSELRVGLVHGRMKAAEKEQVMNQFKTAEIDLLVATTVIEVGVDVPAASLMIIENPERLGLSQLHQLRGRVGRGAVASHCALMYHSPLGQQARERLAVMRETSDGFLIAQKDLELRGPGEVLGIRQTGEMQFQIADILREKDLLPSVQQAADHILQTCPDSVPALIRRWLGENTRYAHV